MCELVCETHTEREKGFSKLNIYDVLSGKKMKSKKKMSASFA